MKRSLLISGATVGGIGAALLIVHPHFGSQASHLSSTTALAKVTTTPKAMATSSTKASAKVTTTPKVTASAKPPVPTPSASNPATSVAPSPTSVRSSASTAPALKKVSGIFTGDVVDVNYGSVQVQVTIEDGKITDAQALMAPSGRSDRYTQYALPILRQQTLAAQGSNIQGASGASYTSYGWYTSLQSALAKAGL